MHPFPSLNAKTKAHSLRPLSDYKCVQFPKGALYLVLIEGDAPRNAYRPTIAVIISVICYFQKLCLILNNMYEYIIIVISLP